MRRRPSRCTWSFYHPNTAIISAHIEIDGFTSLSADILCRKLSPDTDSHPILEQRNLRSIKKVATECVRECDPKSLGVSHGMALVIAQIFPRMAVALRFVLGPLARDSDFQCGRNAVRKLAEGVAVQAVPVWQITVLVLESPGDKKGKVSNPGKRSVERRV
jgi:hypothetical protein